MNAFINTLTATVANISDLVNLLIPSNRLRFKNTTNANTVATGVTKKNHRKEMSTIIRWGQNGILRWIGNERKKSAEPSRQGKHQMNTARTLFTGRANSCEVGDTQNLKRYSCDRRVGIVPQAI